MNTNEIATKADVEKLLDAIEDLKSSFPNTNLEKKFLRSSDVKKMLNISDGTLQRLRVSKTLIAKKVNGTWFYQIDDIKKLMEVE